SSIFWLLLQYSGLFPPPPLFSLDNLRLNEEIINKCYTTGFRYKTAHLKPPHEYVPWVVENNQPLRQDLEKFVKYVCQAYKGDHKPGACKAQSSSLSSTIHASFAETHPPATPVIDFYKEMYTCYGRLRPSHLLGTLRNCSSLFYGQCNRGSNVRKFP
ncbi:hypothetical protein ES288_A10G279100v1, partial [Gossypium darwinii]